jgi:hypothetical protein
MTAAPTGTMLDTTLARAIESAMAANLRAYVGAVDEIAPDVGAACIDVAGGVAAFTGIGSPLTTVKGVAPDLTGDDLDEIEALFSALGVAAVTIEAAPWLTADSQRVLAGRGYHVVDHEDVVAMTSVGSLSSAAERRTEPLQPEVWAELQLRCSEISETSTAGVLVAAASRLAGATNLGLADDRRWIACAQSVPYGAVAVLGNDATLPEARRRGAQAALIGDRLLALPPGTIAAAEVEPGGGSERNYLRGGFAVAYARRHFVSTASAPAGISDRARIGTRP